MKTILRKCKWCSNTYKRITTISGSGCCSLKCRQELEQYNDTQYAKRRKKLLDDVISGKYDESNKNDNYLYTEGDFVKHTEKTSNDLKVKSTKTKNWYMTNWVWFWMIFCWPLGCYGIYKRYFK